MRRLVALGLFGTAGVLAAIGTRAPEPAGAAASPCSLLDRTAVGRLLGSTQTPEVASVDGAPGCLIALADGRTVAWSDRRGSSTSFDAARERFQPDHTQDVDGYVDGAFFAWGRDGSLDFVARRQDETVVLKLTGSTSGFDVDDPKASAPDGDLRGSVEGSALWILTTQVFSHRTDVGDPPRRDDLSGLWRTTDITPCAPAGSIHVRVSRVAATSRSITATKVSGDSCLDDRATDFEGTIDGAGVGDGRAFGTIGGSRADSTQYRLTVLSATSIRLTGEAGALRYTREYERLSWPGLDARPAGSSLLGIPSPAETLTARNVALTAVLSTFLLALVAFPTTLFNKALESNLDHYRVLFARTRRRLPRRRAARTDKAAASPWRAVAVYLGAAGVLASFLQPGWGLNMATLITFVGFLGSFVATSAISVVATRAYLAIRYKAGGGVPTVVPATLGVTAALVVASRLVGFVPGYLYGVFVSWESRHRRDREDRARITAFAGIVTLAVAVVAWLLIPTCRDLEGSHPNTLASLPLGIVGGVLVGAVHTLTIGLMPIEFMPGRDLQRQLRSLWLALWASGGFLFVLVLLHPGLESGSSRSIVGTVVLVATATALSVGFWAYHAGKLRRPGSPPVGAPGE